MRIQHTLSAVLAGLLLAAALSAPALAAEDTRIRTREEAARHAVQLAAEDGGADSIRYALWEGGEITRAVPAGESIPAVKTGRLPRISSTVWARCPRRIRPQRC